MSGPKVVRIVTREELIAICEGQMARLDAAIAQWMRVGKRNDCLSEDDIMAAENRRKQIAAMLAKERYREFQKAAPQEVEFFQSEMDSRLEQLAEQNAAKRTHERRTAQVAASLLAELRSSGKAFEPSLTQALERVAKGNRDDAAVASAFTLLSSGQSGPTEAFLNQAAQFREQGLIEKWMPPSPALDRLESRLAGMRLLIGEDPRFVRWEGRLLDAHNELDVRRRNLLVDSLEVELGKATTEARALSVLRNELLLLISELKQAGLASAPSYETILGSASQSKVLEEAITRGKRELDALRAAQASKARRTAVLDSLAGLGYEVTEGMTTSWVDQGRVVIRNPDLPGYGVEVVGTGDLGRMQIRAVAFSEGHVGPDPSRDADVETLWCGDVSKLTALLYEAGSHLMIEKATPIGATPLKRIELSEQEASRLSREAPPLKGRMLP